MVQELFTLDTGDAICHSLAFDKATKSLAVGCSDALIKFINIEKEEVTSNLKGHDDATQHIYRASVGYNTKLICFEVSHYTYACPRQLKVDAFLIKCG